MTKNDHKDQTPASYLDDEQLLADIKRTIEQTSVPEPVDFGAIAVRAVNDYWDERERGLIDKDGNPTDASPVWHQLALRRLPSPNPKYSTQLLVMLGPPLIVLLYIWLSSNRWLGSTNWYLRIAGLLCVSALLVATRAFMSNYRERGPLQSIGTSLFGGMMAAAFLLGGTGYGERVARHNSNQTLYKTTTAMLHAKRRMLDVSKIMLDNSLAQSSTPKGREKPILPYNIELPNKTIMKVSTEAGSNEETIIYRGQPEGVPGSVVATINVKSGSGTLIAKMDNGDDVGSVSFFLGVLLNEAVHNDESLNVENLRTGDKLSLRLKDDFVGEVELGEHNYVFVVTDPTSTEVTEVQSLGLG